MLTPILANPPAKGTWVTARLNGQHIAVEHPNRQEAARAQCCFGSGFARAILATAATALLLPAGCDNSTSLHEAVHREDKAAVERVLAEGADPNARDTWGRTALHIAAGEDTTGAIVKILAEQGADVEARMPPGWTPMHQVAHVAAARSLVTHGAKINPRDHYGQTPLHMVVSRTPSQVVGTRIWPPPQSSVVSVIPTGRDLVDFLIANGADMNARDDVGRTPLHAACRAGSLDYVRLLVSHGAELSVKDAMGCTALDYAIMGGYASTAQFLTQRGAPKTGTVLPPRQP